MTRCPTCRLHNGTQLAANIPISEKCQTCALLNKNHTTKKKVVKENKAEYEGYNENQWRKDYFNENNGGYLVIDNDRIAYGKQNKQEQAKFNKEYAMCLTLAKAGYKIEYLKLTEGKYDIHLDRIPADLKKTASANNMIKYAKKATRDQGAEIVVFEFEKMTGRIHDQLNWLKSSDIKVKYFITGNNEVIDL
jgi:hypothetical protein